MRKLPGIVLDVQNLPDTIFTLPLKLNRILSAGRNDGPLVLEGVTVVCGSNNTDLNSNLLLVLIVPVTVGIHTHCLGTLASIKREWKYLPQRASERICLLKM